MYDMNAEPYVHKSRSKQEGTRPEPISVAGFAVRKERIEDLAFFSQNRL